MRGVDVHVGRGESPHRRQLARLISESLIDPVFQPIVDVRRAAITGFEALTRPRADSGFSDPGVLFDVAEGSGMLWPLEQVTRRAAFDAAAGWSSGILLFMNCSPQVFADERFADEVQASVLATTGLSPGRVVLEITERSEQEHIDSLTRQVAALKERGFQIAIDDVGAGTSGLNRIMRLRPHWLKLDRDLIDSIDRDRVKQNLIRFMVHFARLSGVRIIAEGVERAEELATLMDLGIVHAQGYFLGKPGSRHQTLHDDVVGWLRQRWADTQSVRLSRPAGQRISRLIRPAFTVEARTPIAEVATLLREEETIPGAVIVDESGVRCVGWAERDWLMERAASEQAGYPIAAILPSCATLVSPEDSIHEVVEILSARDPRFASHPLIVVQDSRLLGIVTVHDVLSTVSEMSRNPLVRTAPITGMPGRIYADEHLAAMLSQSAPLPRSQQHDAMLVDIRHFSDYNGAYGYELGDQLLQELCNALRIEVMSCSPHVFAAHIGDDRFLVTAPPGVLMDRLPHLVSRFEQAASALSAAPIGAETSGREGIGIRAVLAPSFASQVEDARGVFRLFSEMKAAAENAGYQGERLGSSSVLLRGQFEPVALRLTA